MRTIRCTWRALLAAVAIAAAAPAMAAAAGPLLTGQTLLAGQSIASPDGHYALIMQTDGNLVLYLVDGPAGLRALWWSGTSGDAGARAVLQANGNLVLYDPANQALWSSNTSGPACTNLTVQDDGNLVLYEPGKALWASRTVHTTLSPGEYLMPGERIFSSSEQYELVMQGDGNLVVYCPAGALWSSRTWGIPGNWTVMQGDGNLVVYTTARRALWSTGTFHNPGADAVMQDDGNFVVYHGSTPLWNSHTEGNRPHGPTMYPRPAFVPCPPPPAPPPPPSAPPAAPVVLVPTPTREVQLRRLRVRMTMSWEWNRDVTRLHRITIRHLPRHVQITASCRGRGCPRHRERVGRRRLTRLVRFLDGRAFRSGDRLTISVFKPGFRVERVAVQIRYGKLPRVRLL